MKVLFLTTSYPSAASPLDGIFVREHARAAAEVADVRVLHVQRARGRSLLRAEPIAGDEPPAWRLPYRVLPKPVSVAAFLAAPALALRRFRGEGWAPDLVHSHSFLSTLPALLLRRPVAYTEHWSILLPERQDRLAPALGAVARLALRRADMLVPPSQAMASALRALAPSTPIRVVPNVVDPVFAPGGSRPAVVPARLVTAGLLDSDAKGVDLVLDAVARLDGRVRLDVVGDGSLRPRYEALARSLGVADAVTWHGLRPKADLAALMRAADLFVLGSRYENNPCVVLEALACGLPVVATRVGGVPELVPDDAGVLVEPNDPAALARGIEHALAQRDRFDRGSLARRANERYGRSAVAQRLAEVYAELLGPAD